MNTLRLALQTDGAFLVVGEKGIFIPYQQLYELKFYLEQVELCKECYHPIATGSGLGSGYRVECWQKVAERFASHICPPS